MIPIPNPLPISCTECHQPMRVEHQSIAHARDEIIVAAECGCGRIIGSILPCRGRPFIRADIVADSRGDIGKEAAHVIGYCRERIADMERLIAAATWANGGREL